MRFTRVILDFIESHESAILLTWDSYDMICSMHLMHHYYNYSQELYTRNINQPHHLTIVIDRKLITRLKLITISLKVTIEDVELILRHLCVKLPFCLIIISKIIFKSNIHSQHQANPSPINSMSNKSSQNKLNPQTFIELIMITVYKTSLTIDLTLIRTIPILIHDHLFLTT